MGYEPNPNALQELLASPQAQAFVKEAAEAAAEAIKAAMPVTTGYNVGNVGVSDGGEGGKAGATITTGSSEWHWVEYGTAYNPAYAPFRTGVESVGIKFEDTGGG